MTNSPDLGRLERWLREVITHANGPAAGAACASARRQLEVPPDQLQLVIAPSSRLSAAQRLALYQRSYHARLLEAIRAPYPGLRHMLGSELFDDFALEYIHARPSRSYTLRTLAARLPDYLAATRPDAGADAESWVDLMIDLARLEVVVAEVYDGHGAEDMRIPDAPPGRRGCRVARMHRRARAVSAAGPLLVRRRAVPERDPPRRRPRSSTGSGNLPRGEPPRLCGDTDCARSVRVHVARPAGPRRPHSKRRFERRHRGRGGMAPRAALDRDRLLRVAVSVLRQ